jgi:protein-tyrosine phosphatase
MLLKVTGWFARGTRPTDVDYRRVRRVVFVCKGNICRSAYARALARERGFSAASCGLSTTPGCPADEVAARVAARRGLRLEDHRTIRWKDIPLRRDDLVLAMEPWHLAGVHARVVGVGAQAALLGLWSTPNQRVISDPFGLAESDFEQCFDMIDAAVGRLAQQISLAQGNT